MYKLLKNEIVESFRILKNLDKKVVTVFLAIGILQTISWYFTSRRFFRRNFYYTDFAGNPNVDLYEFYYWFLGDFLMFFVIPVLIIYLIFKDKPKNYGVSFGNVKLGMNLTILFTLFMIPILWIVSASPEFAAKYPLLKSAKTNISHFLIFEFGLLLYLTAWEYIWRGFTVFGLEEKFGYYAAFIQMIPFVILHNGKPFPETLGAVFGGVALGILALRTRSFIYCVLVHFNIMFIIDLMSTLRYHTNEYGIGLSAIYNLLLYLFQ
jgi:membrane protease YdiL (CAAX protease family)